MEPRTFKEDTIVKVAQDLLQAAPGKVWAIYGELGSGKTTLIKALMQVLGSEDTAGSPTFGLVNTYVDREGELLAYHFDFYRLENAEEVLDIGFEDYLRSDAWIFMEWPERIATYLPDDCWKLEITALDAETRVIRSRA